MAAQIDLAVVAERTGRSYSSSEIVEEEPGFHRSIRHVMADGGFKVDPSFVQALKDPKQRFTDSMVAKSAREKRRKIIADKKAKRCRAYESNVVSVSPIKEPMVTQIARKKRREIIAAKKTMRCTTSNAVLSNNVQSNQQAKSKGGKNSRSGGEKLQREAREAPWQKQ